MDEVVRQCCGGNNGIDGESDDDEMVDVKRRNKYHVVRMRVSMDENNCRRVELVADSDGDGKVKGEGGGGGGSSIFSISLAMPEDAVDNDDDNDDGVDDDEEDVDENGNPIHGKKDNHSPASLKNNHHPVLLEQLVAAHELALATQRDWAVSDNGNGGVGELLDIFCDLSILPAPELCGEEENDQGIRMVRRVKRGRDRMHLSSTSTTTTTTTNTTTSSRAVFKDMVRRCAAFKDTVRRCVAIL